MMHEGGHLHAFIKVTISEKFNIFMSTLSENLKERIKCMFGSVGNFVVRLSGCGTARCEAYDL